MNLLDLFVRIGVEDDASGEVENISNNVIGNLGQAAMTAGKAIAGMLAVKQVVDFGRAAFDAYSQFEQLEGGVAKLYGNANMELDEYLDSMKDSGKSVDELTKTYERNEEAQRLMMQQASEAWKTAGVDANTYMEQATSMSAALISSLGGDTVKAAEQTDVAMKAISDNVNTFGTDMASVSNAFMGFSKQNYTMLDNLKLGYGGTKEEMERLIADANEWGAANGKASDLSIDSFSDVVTAIEQIQEKQGIAGTTAKEAMSTIEGSMNATKAAWQNLVTEFGKPDADIGARIGDMFTAVFGENGEGGVVRNVINEVGVIATNMINAVRDGISSGVDWIANNGARMVLDAVRGIVSTMSDAASNIASFDLSKLFEGDGSDIGERLSKMVGDITEIFWEWSPDLMEAGSSLLSAIGESIATNGPVLLEKVGEILGSIGNFVLEHAPELVGKIAEAALTLGEWLTSQGPELVTKISEIIGMVVIAARDWLVENGPLILEAVAQLLQNVLNAIAEHGPQIIYNIGETIGTIIGTVAAAASELFPAAVEFFGGLITGTSQEGEKLREWFAGLPETLLNAMGDLASFLFNAGEQIISGFWDGLTSKFSEVQDWVSGIGTWIADHKGPKQYDLGLLVDNGMWIMDSLQRGLEKGLPGVEDTLSGITDTIQTGINASADVSVARGGNDDAILGMLASILNAIPNAVYLDGRALVGQLAPDMNAAMGVL